jgi:hypothetical protein
VPGARPYVVRGSESLEERGGSFIHAHPADDDDDDDDRVGGGVCGYWGRLLSSPLLSREARKGQQAPEITTARSARTGWDGTETKALVAASTGCGSSSSSLFLSLLNYISLKACKAFEQSTTKGDVNLVPRTQEFIFGEF